jgi:hypothetical protein
MNAGPRRGRFPGIPGSAARNEIIPLRAIL